MARPPRAASQLIAVMMHLPWPIETGLAVFFFLLFRSMAAPPAAALGAPAAMNLQAFISEMACLLEYLLPAALLLSAAGSLLKWWRARDRTSI